MTLNESSATGRRLRTTFPAIPLQWTVAPAVSIVVRHEQWREAAAGPRTDDCRWVLRYVSASAPPGPALPGRARHLRIEAPWPAQAGSIKSGNCLGRG